MGAGVKGNKTVFRPSGDFTFLRFASVDTHSITLRDIGIVYPNLAGANNSGRTAVMWGVDGGSDSGFYFHSYRNIYIEGAYDAFALKKGDGKQTMWTSTWDNIRLVGIGHSCFSFNPAVGIGIPVNQFTSIKIFNTQTNVVSSGPAWELYATEVDIRNVDIEGWHNEIATTVGGGFFHMQGLHAEHQVFQRRVRVCFGCPMVVR